MDHNGYGSSSPVLDFVVLSSVLGQPVFVDLGHIANKRLLGRLQDLVEDDPVGFAVLVTSAQYLRLN